MKAKAALVLLASLVATGIMAIAAFTAWVNPLCFFRCDKITRDAQNVNSYYQNAQRILEFPETELVVLGSSRGESLPLEWLAGETKMAALNLSVGGAEIQAKAAFLEFARRNLKLKRVIWLADYFDLMDETQSDKIKFTPALRLLAPDLGALGYDETLRKLALLTDHNSVEAALALLKKRRRGFGAPDRGSSAEKDAAKCDAELSASQLTEPRLKKEIGIIFDGYAHKILRPAQQEKYFLRMEAIARQFAQAKVDFILAIPAYHREFMARLKREFPEIAARHDAWVGRLENLRRTGIRVFNFFSGIPGDDGSPKFWTDGVHFTCYGAMQMLRGL